MRRPVVWLALLFGIGIILAHRFELAGESLILSAGVALIVAFIAYVVARKLNPLIIGVLFVLLGMSITALYVSDLGVTGEAWRGQNLTLEGVVARDADVRPGRAIYVLEVQGVQLGAGSYPVKTRVLLSHYEAEEVYGYGDVLRAQGIFRIPDPPGNPGQFNYQAYLQRQGVSGLLTVRGEDSVVKLGADPQNPFVFYALQFKEQFTQGLHSVLSEEQAALVQGITLGVRGSLDAGLQDQFTAAGVVHILSVSGLHVGFLVGLVLFVFRWRPLRVQHPAWLILAVALVLIYYAVMVGFKPSVVRASIMALLLLSAYQLGQMRDWPTALAVAALVILIANPLALFDPGFQLSFSATWAILYLGPVLVQGMQRVASRHLNWKLPAAYGWILAVPLAAQLGTLPLVAYYYNIVSPVAILANIIVTPLTAIIFILGLLTALLSVVVPVLSIIAAPALGALVDLLSVLVNCFAALPGAYFYVATPSLLLVLAWYPLLYLTLVPSGPGKPWQGWRETAQTSIKKSGHRIAGVAAVTLFVLLGLTLWWPGDGSYQDLRVHFIDVGQGDSTLLQTPAGKSILIDAGGWPGELAGDRGVGHQVVVPYLLHLGVSELDILVLTHPHEDHVGGAWALLDKIDIRQVIVAPESEGEEVPPEYYQLLEAFLDAGVPVEEVWAGDRIRVESSLTLDVLGPSAPLLSETRSDLNNNSVVLWLKYGEMSFLFPGDVEQEGQARLLAQRNLKTDVLKFPHHGSGAFVPAFLHAVAPEVAVLSLGANNRFGHPHASALAILEELVVEVYRTDKDGAVIIYTDGLNLQIRSGQEEENPGQPAA